VIDIEYIQALTFTTFIIYLNYLKGYMVLVLEGRQLTSCTGKL